MSTSTEQRSITVYTRSTCAPCQTVKMWLKRKGLTFEEKNVDDNPEFMAEVFKKSGFRMVPVVEINDRIVSGLNLGLLNEAISGIIQ